MSALRVPGGRPAGGTAVAVAVAERADDGGTVRKAMNPKLLKDKYRLLRLADEDESFRVFEGEMIDRPDEPVEIHVLKNRWLRDSALVQRIAAEYQGMEKLSHPGVAKIHDIDFFKNIYFIVKEKCDGHPLEALFARRYAFSTLQAINLATQLARTLAHAAREGVRHRSVTPADLVVTRDLKLKVVRFRAPRAATAPGDGPVPGPAGDLFFLGCLLHDLLGGGGALDGERDLSRGAKSPESLLPCRDEADPATAPLRRIVYRCVTRDPAERYAHYDDLLRDLREAVQTDVDAQAVRSAMEIAAPPARQEPAEAEVDARVALFADAPEEMLLDQPARRRSVDFGESAASGGGRAFLALLAALGFLAALFAYIFW